ncbi:hypothetical protein E4U44_002398 [Claviceps purpurea]|nr:hypothetical protein E4U44_002398 [Claviceps purpurea]
MFDARRPLDLPPERRSRLKLNGAGICQTCRADEGSEVPQFSSENNLDPGGVPTHLEQLPYTDIEEILIAHVRTAVNVFQDRRALFLKGIFTVRRSVVKAWLDFLRQNHPGYADFEIDNAALAALSSFVARRLTESRTITVDEVQEAFEDPESGQGRHLLDSIVRQSRKIKTSRMHNGSPERPKIT